MVDHAYRIARDEQASGNASAERSSRIIVSWGLAAGAIVLGFGLMPHVYGMAVFGATYPESMRGPVLNHVVFNCAANIFVVLSALRISGRLDRSLAIVLRRVLLAHGVLAFATLISRYYYSSQIMLLGAAVSAVFGGVTIYLRHRTSPVRAALVGDWHPIASQMRIPFDHIADPDADLRFYDLLLTSDVVGISAQWSQALSRAMLSGKPVRHIAEYLEEDRGVVSVEHFDLEHLPEAGLTSYRLRKRLIDIGLVLVAVPVALPILALASLVVFTTMGGPVLFVQERVGLGGKPFRMYKLRTMRAARPIEVGIATIPNDRRITPVGRWLRRFRIDELPQLWNVLKGDMSVVGPRPEQPSLADEYCRHIPAFAYRSMVRPGITGWAQVRAGYAANLSETRIKLGYDLFYLKNFSFSLDLQILGRTVWTLASGGGVR